MRWSQYWFSFLLKHKVHRDSHIEGALLAKIKQKMVQLLELDQYSKAKLLSS